MPSISQFLGAQLSQLRDLITEAVAHRQDSQPPAPNLVQEVLLLSLASALPNVPPSGHTRVGIQDGRNSLKE